MARSVSQLSVWEFRADHDFNSASGWTKVTVPHDWAIWENFDINNDLQEVAVLQNGETSASLKTGRTGGLPYVGKGCYICTVKVQDLTDRHILLFDGAMSEARVLVNGTELCFWPYGYNSFSCEIDSAIHSGDNEIVVLLENRPQSSRWYPGAGLFRKVRLLSLPKMCIPVWGVNISTPVISDSYAIVRVATDIDGMEEGSDLTIRTEVFDAVGRSVQVRCDSRSLRAGKPAVQNITVDNPCLWSPENPQLYTARTTIYTPDGNAVDSCDTRFGIRSIELRADKGFFLNGTPVKFKGVCLHHDLGPLGAAVNISAIRHQLTILKDMGCNAIRTSHNMPAEELVELCDEMGFMMMLEPFDEWDVAKCENGYHRWFNADSGNGVTWAERDMVNMLRHYRNNPSVVMWSIGNEVPTQSSPDGYEVASFLQDICHREDPSRPVTCGMDQFDAVVNNGFAAILDLPGFNYKPHRYREAYDKLPQNLVLGSESASTVSSRGVYHFPVEQGYDKMNSDHQCSSYDVEHCWWSNIPDVDFAADEDLPWCVGQFVWTGFDYLGEPSPYDTDAWPNHSSMFGIVDLASLPKDRYWFYRSIWRPDEPTLHVLPHWTWPGREGENVPVMAYSSAPAVELFVNGVSQGVRHRDGRGVWGRYRFVWDDVVYEPGEIRVVSYDDEGAEIQERTVRTAGKPYAIKISGGLDFIAESSLASDAVYAESVSSRSASTVIQSDEELTYLTVSIVDRDGNLCPDADNEIFFTVSGDGSFEAVANGDPCCLESFKIAHIHAFHGKLTLIVRASSDTGCIRILAKSSRLKSNIAEIESKI